jgi:hypothetical protein
MILYRRAGRPSFSLGVPTRSSAWVERSTGTDHRPTDKAIGRSRRSPGARVDLLGAVADGTLALGPLYDAYRFGDLDGLRLRRADVDLTEQINGWAQWLNDRGSR